MQRAARGMTAFPACRGMTGTVCNAQSSLNPAPALDRPALGGRACPGGSSGSSLQLSRQQLFGAGSISSSSSIRGRQDSSLVCNIWPFDAAWGVSVDTQTLVQTLPQNLFALSLFPYLGFLYHLTRSKQAPPLALFGFYFLLVFVGASIPAGIYAKTHYQTSLANVDWLHGGAESLLTITNLLIVLGLRQGIRQAEEAAAAKASSSPPPTAAEGSAEQQAVSADQ